MKVSKAKINQLYNKLEEVVQYSKLLENKFQQELSDVHPKHQTAAKNLVDYLALRNFDLKKEQRELAKLGLSSIGRAENHVMANIRAVQRSLKKLIGENGRFPKDYHSFEEGEKIILENSESLLGKGPENRRSRIMVTMPSEAANDYTFVQELLQNDVNCIRVNCAHDNSEDWKKMISHVQSASDKLNKECKILMDLAGPKIRTGKISGAENLIKIKPNKDDKGNILEPAQIIISLKPNNNNEEIKNHIQVTDPKFIKKAKKCDTLSFIENRGKNRYANILETSEDSILIELYKTTYISEKTIFTLEKKGEPIYKTSPVNLPLLESPILLSKGDTIIVHAENKAGEESMYDKNKNLIREAHIPCTEPEVFKHVKKGERILFDDGKIGGVITEVLSEKLCVKITFAKNGGSKLKSDKGINFPDSDLKIKGFTDKDATDLEFALEYADGISMSFVNQKEDVQFLLKQINGRKEEGFGIVLKIETKRAVENLPILLLEVMKTYPAGIMIARGDLAVECGWVDLAILQEEILWLYEAALLPHIWATQVLENLAKKELPSRSEITDAAMAERAECVMLNKGPHIIETINVLSKILSEMSHHQNKKSFVLSKLKRQKGI